MAYHTKQIHRQCIEENKKRFTVRVHYIVQLSHNIGNSLKGNFPTRSLQKNSTKQKNIAIHRFSSLAAGCTKDSRQSGSQDSQAVSLRLPIADCPQGPGSPVRLLDCCWRLLRAAQCPIAFAYCSAVYICRRLICSSTQCALYVIQMQCEDDIANQGNLTSIQTSRMKKSKAALLALVMEKMDIP